MTVEDYFRKILSPPPPPPPPPSVKKSTPPFLLIPQKIQKLQVPPLFAKIEIFLDQPPHPVERGGGGGGGENAMQDFWYKKFP